MVNHITKLSKIPYFRGFPLFGVQIFMQLCFCEIFINKSLLYDGEKDNGLIENSELVHRTFIFVKLRIEHIICRL